MRTRLLTIIAISVLAASARAQDVPRDTPPVPQNPSPTFKSSASATAPHDRAPIMGEVSIGERAPDFVLDASTGSQEQLSKTRGQWVLLVFADRYRELSGFDAID